MKLNFWPFNRPRPVAFRETVKSLPPAPCGDQYEHYYWTDLEGMSCPVCAGQKARRRELQAEDRLASKIANQVAQRLAATSPAPTLVEPSSIEQGKSLDDQLSQAFHDYYHKIKADVGHDEWLRIGRFIAGRIARSSEGDA